jgi:CelD/BcsL family acetyltransferase involved in cellulose biosynthesis
MTRKIIVIQSLAELESLRDDWNRLSEAVNSPLLSHKWQLAAASAFSQRDRLHVVTIWSDDRLVAVAPLTRAHRRGQTWLELIGASRLHEPGGLLFADQDCLASLCTAMADLPYPVILQRITQHEAVLAALTNAARAPGRVIARQTPGSPFLLINNKWSDYFGSLSSRRRQDFRRARNRLERQGAISVECLAPAPGELPALLERAYRVESSGWKGRNGSGLAVNPALRHFFDRYAEAASRRGQLRICFLNAGGTPIAMQLATVTGDRWWVLKIGYDEQWADYSPGMQLTMETVRIAFESGIQAYEFLGVSEPWLQIWTRQEHTYATLMHYPANLRGRMAWLVDSLVRRLGAAVKRVARQPAGHHPGL